jgi:cytochrome b pre-mRNA-processing protein 3
MSLSEPRGWSEIVQTLDEMPRSLNPLAPLLGWRHKNAHADKVYGSIVAQTRLPVFYQEVGVPDTLEGRFLVLSLHLFVVLHRLRGAGDRAETLAQELADRFAADMETVLRELGVGDLSIPKKVKGLTASGATLLQDYEKALSEGEAALDATIAHALPLVGAHAKAASARLTPYVMRITRRLQEEPLKVLYAGTLRLPEP